MSQSGRKEVEDKEEMMETAGPSWGDSSCVTISI